MSKKDNIFDISYILHLLGRYWILILSMLALGVAATFCYNEFSTPLYKSKISIFTWNRSITEAMKKVKKSHKEKISEEGS